MSVVAGFLQRRQANDLKVRDAWRLEVGLLGVAVYPKRPINIPVLSAIPSLANLLTRRQIVVQVLNAKEASGLLRAPAAPSELTIMKGSLSSETIDQIREQFPEATLVEYPNMPL
jgi:hypothetical protein